MSVRKNNSHTPTGDTAIADGPMDASAAEAALPYMNISDLSRKLDISPRTIRYYEEIGLLDSIKRTVGGKRVFTDNDFRRIRFIQKLKILGLTLAEMQELNAIYETHRKNSKVFPRIIELFDNHKKSIDHRIDELRLLKTEIEEFQKRMRDKLKKERE